MMPDTNYPVQMIRGLPVVTPPAEVDASNADALRAALHIAAARGHVTIVVDMSHTEFCDSTGLSVLVRAHKRAVAEGGELRLVISSAAVLRIMEVVGVDQLIPSFTSLEGALAEAPAIAIRPPDSSLPEMRIRAGLLPDATTAEGAQA
jgi:anti-anti-sigma factor